MSPRTLSEKKHQAILEAAATEFRAAGYLGTSMDRISERARVSKRTVYNHFPSKDDLFRAIVEDLWNRAHAATDVPFDADTPIQDQLTTIARAEMKLLADREFLELVRALMAAVVQTPELGGSILQELGERDLAIVSWVEAATEHGALDATNAEIAGQQFIAMIKAFAFWPQIMTGQPPLDSEEAEVVVTSAVDVFLAAYGA